MIKRKHCPRCNKYKPLSEFGKSNQTKTRKNCWCLECCREVAKEYRQTPAGIYQNIKGRCKYNERHDAYNRKHHKFNITKKEFIEWYEKQPKLCAYCDIPEEKLSLLKDSTNKSKKLNIDRIDNDKGYEIGNMVLSCTRCNYIKSDFFTFDEMREIGQKHVKSHWEAILKNKL